MDKRSLLFIVTVSLVFLGVNLWFGRQRDSERILWQKQQEVKLEKSKKENEAKAAEKRAFLTDLPNIELYSDEEQLERVTRAALVNNGAIALAWTDRLPAVLYSPELGKLELTSKSHKLGEPVFYSLSNPSKSQLLPAISSYAPIDLQLLTASLEPRVVFGQNRGSSFVLPYEELKENAFVYLKGMTGYVPVGIFDAMTQKVRPFSDFERLKGHVLQAQVQLAMQAGPNGEEYYVLENEYQQLVFSTRGGSLAEINLPFTSTNDRKSYVKPIEADRLIAEQSPNNARFPLYPAHFAGGQGDALQEGTEGGYYPLLRRSQAGKESIDPQYYGLNLVKEGDSSLSQLSYRVTRFERDLIQFEASSPERRIVKTYRIPQERNGPYCFELEVLIDGDAEGVWISSGVPEVELMSGSFSPLLRYQLTPRPYVTDVETVEPSDKQPILTNLGISPHWISNSNGFLGVIVDPLTQIGQGYRAAKIPGGSIPTRLSLIDANYQLHPASKYPGYVTYLALKSGAAQTFRVFAGPYDDALLKELDELYDNPVENYNPQYNLAQSIQGWFSFISQPFSKFLYFLLQMFYTVTNSWGFSIILLTIALRLMMYPLNNWSIRSTLKMQEIAPKVKAIQDKYKKDPKKAQGEVMNLYRSQGVNPFSGCFPILLQMPFLIGMFYLLKSTFPLRGASFIPGWIDNLAAPDVLFSWNYPIFLIGTEFHLLPIVLGATMFLQQKMSSTLPSNASELSDSQKQQKMMGNIMSIVFTVMFYSFPSGLNIYFISSTLLGVLQQWYLTKKMKTSAPKLAVKK